MAERGACRCGLVWDVGRIGTAETSGGADLEVRESHGWTPGKMLSLAAQSSLMFEFLKLAEDSGLEVLGYVSSGSSMPGRADRAPAGGLVLSPCIVLESEEDTAQAEELLEKALAASSICRLLPGGVALDPHLVVALRVPA